MGFFDECGRWGIARDTSKERGDIQLKRKMKILRGCLEIYTYIVEQEFLLWPAMFMQLDK